MKTATKGVSVMTVAVLVLAVSVIGSFVSCSYISDLRNSAFDDVLIGDTEASVVARFGIQPSFREVPGVLFSRYATHPCDGKCAVRLWFENRLSLDTEAWSVELDTNNRVIKKSRWVSP